MIEIEFQGRLYKSSHWVHTADGYGCEIHWEQWREGNKPCKCCLEENHQDLRVKILN